MVGKQNRPHGKISNIKLVVTTNFGWLFFVDKIFIYIPNVMVQFAIHILLTKRQSKTWTVEHLTLSLDMNIVFTFLAASRYNDEY